METQWIHPGGWEVEQADERERPFVYSRRDNVSHLLKPYLCVIYDPVHSNRISSFWLFAFLPFSICWYYGYDFFFPFFIIIIMMVMMIFSICIFMWCRRLSMHPGWMSAPSGSSLPLMPFGRFIGHAEAIGCSSLHLLFSTASLSSSSSSLFFFFSFSFSFSFASWKVQFGGGAGGGSECYDDRHSFPLLFFPLSFLIFLIFLNGFDFLVSFFGFHPLPHPTLTLFQNENTQQTRQQNKKPTETGGLKWTILFLYIYIFKKFETKKNQETKKRNDNNQTFHPSAM